jgi:hypothetical protein
MHPQFLMSIFKDRQGSSTYPGDDVVSSLPQHTLSNIALKNDSECEGFNRSRVHIGSILCL